MKTIARTLGVARSNVIERRDGKRPQRGPQERPGDIELAGAIRRLVDARPTYGYRRIAALLKRERRSDGLVPVNTKRVYRLMQKHGLLLEQTKSSSCSLRRASRLLRGAGHRHAERDGADLPADLHSSYDHPRAELVAMDA